jgi:hypothetical protein
VEPALGYKEKSPSFWGIFGQVSVKNRFGDDGRMLLANPETLLNSTSNSRFMKREVLRFVVVRQQHPGVVHALG